MAVSSVVTVHGLSSASVVGPYRRTNDDTRPGVTRIVYDANIHLHAAAPAFGLAPAATTADGRVDDVDGEGGGRYADAKYNDTDHGMAKLNATSSTG